MTDYTPTLEEVIREAITNRLLDVHVALPGRINTYYLSEQAADVQPLLKRSFVTVDGDEIEESLPVIPKVPVVFPRSNDFFITFPLKPGDLVTLVFIERSIDTWTAKEGEEVDPVDTRMHSLSDAVAYPGLYPFSKAVKDAHATNMVIGQDSGPQIHIKPSDEIHLGSENAADFVALAAKIATELTKINTAIVAAIAAVTPNDGGLAAFQALQTSLSGASFPSSVAATKIKAD